jgi:hypothetical protein
MEFFFTDFKRDEVGNESEFKLAGLSGWICCGVGNEFDLAGLAHEWNSAVRDNE